MRPLSRSHKARDSVPTASDTDSCSDSRRDINLNVVFGLFCFVSLTLSGLIFIAFGYQFIRETQSVLNQNGKRFLIPFLEKVLKRSITANAQKARQFEISFFVPVVTSFSVSWVSLAYGVARITPIAYEHADRLSFWLMLKHYLWQLVDMVPLVEAWKHVHIGDPILENSLWPGILVIFFRLIMLYIVLSAAAKLFGFEKSKNVED